MMVKVARDHTEHQSWGEQKLKVLCTVAAKICVCVCLISNLGDLKTPVNHIAKVIHLELTLQGKAQAYDG